MNKLSFSKGLVLLTTALFLVGGFFVGTGTAFAVGPNTWTVDPACTNVTPGDDPLCDTAGTYLTIQGAINAATAGDTINVVAGPYTENLTVDKSLTIIGAGVGTVITGNINVTGDNVTIQALKITNSNVPDYGVKATAGKALTLNNVTVDVAHDGISMYDVSMTATTININNSNIRGYAAIYLYDPANSTTDTNADVNINVNNTSLTGVANDDGSGSNDFAVIGTDYIDDVHIAFTGGSVTNEYTVGAQAKEFLIWFYNAGNNSVTGSPTYTNGPNSKVNENALFVSSLNYTNTVAGQVVARYVSDTTEFETALASVAMTPIVVGRGDPAITTIGNNTLNVGTTLLIEANNAPTTIALGTTLVNNGAIIIEPGATFIDNGTISGSGTISGTVGGTGTITIIPVTPIPGERLPMLGTLTGVTLTPTLGNVTILNGLPATVDAVSNPALFTELEAQVPGPGSIASHRYVGFMINPPVVAGYLWSSDSLKETTPGNLFDFGSENLDLAPGSGTHLDGTELWQTVAVKSGAVYNRDFRTPKNYEITWVMKKAGSPDITVTELFTVEQTLPVPADTTPDAFSLTDQTGVALSTMIESNIITVAGINASADVSVVGGEYSVNGGAYTSISGAVSVGNTVKVRHTSSASNNTAVNTTLTIGGVSDTFTSTTVAAAPDITPPTTPVINTVTTDDIINVTERTATVTVTGTNESGSTVTLNGNAVLVDTATTWHYVLTTVAIDAFGQGSETLTAIATDTAGNPNAVNGTRGITVDTVDPVSNAGADQTKNALFIQTGTATDSGSGVSGYDWNFISGPGLIIFSNVTGSGTNVNTNVSASVDGTYVLRLTVSDIAGNVHFNDMTLVWDTVAPAAFTTGAVNTTSVQPPNIASYWNGTDIGAHFLVPFANDTSLTGGTMQLQANVDGGGYISFGSLYEIHPWYLNTSILFGVGSLEGIAGFSEGVSVNFRAIITDKAGNSTTGTPSVTTLTVDQTPPVINLHGVTSVNVEYGSTYTDTGYDAQDGIHGSVTVIPSGLVNTFLIGSYPITYNASDAAGNPAVQVTRTVNVVKANPTATLAVSNSPLTYSGVGQAALVGITVSSTPGAVANILTGDAATQTNAATYAVTADFVPTDTTNYNTLTGLSAGNLVIDKATLTVTADAQNKLSGASDPALTYTHSALAGGDTDSVFTGVLIRVAGEGVGAYAITQNTLSAGGNYNISFLPGTFTITAPAPSGGGGGGRVIPAVPATQIEGCKPGSGDLFDTTSGKSCTVRATPAGQVLGAEKFNFSLFLKWGPPFNVKVKGPEVMELQKFLNTAGYGPLVVDGLFGGRTKSALVKYQIANGLKGDGVVGPLTRAALNK